MISFNQKTLLSKNVGLNFDNRYVYKRQILKRNENISS